jgi:hypothetical protein
MNALLSQKEEKRLQLNDSNARKAPWILSEIVGCHDWYKLYLNIAKVDKLPTLEAGPDGKIHVLHRGPVLPPSGLVYRRDAPHASGAWLPKLIS